eukprot:GHVR01133522.1.p1 GENE.GHVR01133522.1~~GHVR01133522.1.p1  ORF type:complete len:439 (+),score=127.67 GHVR01133522.1:86-1402(+)
MDEDVEKSIESISTKLNGLIGHKSKCMKLPLFIKKAAEIRHTRDTSCTNDNVPKRQVSQKILSQKTMSQKMSQFNVADVDTGVSYSSSVGSIYPTDDYNQNDIAELLRGSTVVLRKLQKGLIPTVDELNCLMSCLPTFEYEKYRQIFSLNTHTHTHTHTHSILNDSKTLNKSNTRRQQQQHYSRHSYIRALCRDSPAITAATCMPQCLRLRLVLEDKLYNLRNFQVKLRKEVLAHHMRRGRKPPVPCSSARQTLFVEICRPHETINTHKDFHPQNVVEALLRPSHTGPLATHVDSSSQVLRARWRCVVKCVDAVHKCIHKARASRQDIASTVSSACVQHHEWSLKLQAEQRTHQERERVRLLKENNMEEYLLLVSQTKNKRLQQLLDQTSSFLSSLGQRVNEQKDASGIPPGKTKGSRRDDKTHTHTHTHTSIRRNIS